ncbi:hypothetical protein PANDA_003898, partial [Ailuropoda melanoleuca]
VSLLNKPKCEVTPEEPEKWEDRESNMGPLSVLTVSQDNTLMLIHGRNSEKPPAHVKASDGHSTWCWRSWTESPRAARAVSKVCHLSRLFLCRDLVVLVPQNTLIAGQ